MAKSPDAFRTISEVADWLGIQAHVLRFWESKFTQVKPIKRAGGRRYYRPADMLLLGGIKKLLHDDGLTIKGVQKILREEGMTHVADMSEPLDELTMSQLDDTPPKKEVKPATAVSAPEEEKGVVLNFEGGSAGKADKNDTQDIEKEQEVTPEPKAAETVATPEPTPTPEREPKSAEAAEDIKTPEPESVSESPVVETKTETPEQISPSAETSEPESQTETPEAPAQETQAAEPQATEAVADDLPDMSKIDAPKTDEATPSDKEDEAEKPAPAAALPAFLRKPLADRDESAPKPEIQKEPEPKEEPAHTAISEPEREAEKPSPEVAPEPPTPKPRIVDLPAFTPEADFPAAPAALTAAFRAKQVKPVHAAEVKILLKQLTALRDSMAARRRNAAQPTAKD